MEFIIIQRKSRNDRFFRTTTTKHNNNETTTKQQQHNNKNYQVFVFESAPFLRVTLGAAQRRKQRRLRSWWWHEQQSIAAALATSLHHVALRGQKKARARGVKRTPQKTRFRSVNLCKEFAYRSKIE